VEDEEEEGGNEVAGEQDISMKICTHEQAFHCISKVRNLQLIQTLPAFLNHCIQLTTAFKKTWSQKSGNKFLCWIRGRNLNEFYIGNV
jgi:hypothetical protein